MHPCLRTLLLAILFLVVTTSLSFAQSANDAKPSYVVRSGHPRVLLTPEMMPEVLRRVGPGGLYQASYQKQVEFLRTSIQAEKPSYRFLEENRYGADFGLTYIVEKAANRDVSPFIEHFRKIWAPDGAGKDGIDTLADALVYDWMYDGFTPEERKRFGNRLGRRLRHYTEKPEITLDGGTYWYNQTWAASLSWARDGIPLKTAVALAILGEGTDYEDDAKKWLDSFALRMPEEFMKKLDQLGGHWPEGPGHASITYGLYLAWQSWLSATGQDLFPKVATLGFHREHPYWLVYDNMPHNGFMGHMDDTGPGYFRGVDTGQFRALHATHYQDGITQTWAKQATEGGWGSWADIFWYNPKQPTVNKNTLPLAYHFQGAGRVYMRNQWGESDDTWAVFSAGPFLTMYGAEGENGTFQITKQGVLAGEAGQSYRTNMLPINQNVVLVYDPAEKYANRGYDQRNDGGPQIPRNWHALEPEERGKIVAYEHTDAYTYIAADVTKAYSHAGNKALTNSEKMKECTRQFLYVRGDPEFFVVYDRVLATDEAMPKTWILHLPGEPQIVKAEKSPDPTTGPGFESSQNADLTVVKVPQGEKFSRDYPWRTDKRGALAIRTILPKQARITKRGGAGFDMWGNPHDAEAGNATDSEASNWTDMDLCLWRMEVEPPKTAKFNQFLHVLIPIADAKDKDTAALAATAKDFKLVEDSASDGVQLKLNGRVWDIKFARQGPLGCTIKLLNAGGKPLVATLSTTVQPNVVPKGLAISKP